jgi:hypothetical protein
MFLTINLLFQQRRALERNHSARCQVHILPRCRVPAPPGCLLPDSEFAKAADENVVATGERAFDQFQDGFKETGRFGFGNAEARLEESAMWSLVRVMNGNLRKQGLSGSGPFLFNHRNVYSILNPGRGERLTADVIPELY